MAIPTARFSVLLFALLAAAFTHAAEDKTTQSPMAPMQIAASPSIIETVIGARPSNEAIKLFNLGDKPVSVAVSVVHWDLDEQNQVRIQPPSPQSLVQWMVINPLNFTIPAKKTQTVRLSIRPTVNPEAGEHRGMIFFNQQLQEEAERTSVQVAFRLGIAVYGLAGEVVRRGILHDLSVQQQKNSVVLDFDIASTGNANVRLSGQYSLWPTTEFPGAGQVPLYQLKRKDEVIPEEIEAIANLPNTPVLAGTRRHILQPIRQPQEPGRYTLYIQGTLGDEAFTKVHPFSVEK